MLGVPDRNEEKLSVRVKGRVVGIADTDLVNVVDIVKLVHALIEAVQGHDVAIGEDVNVLAAEVAAGLLVNDHLDVIDCERLPVLLGHG